MGPGAEDSADDARTITVSTAEIGWPADSWQKRWNRPRPSPPPTPDEQHQHESVYGIGK